MTLFRSRAIPANQLSDYIRRKLEWADSRPAPLVPCGTPRTQVEIDDLLRRRPPGWEFLLYSGYLFCKRQSVEDKWRDYVLGYTSASGQVIGRSSIASFTQDLLRTMQQAAENLERVLAESAQEWAFGRPGEPGDADVIEHLAARIIASYEELLDQASVVRSARVPEPFEEAMRLAAQLADRPLTGIREFIDRCVECADDIPSRLSKGHPLQIDVDLTLSLDNELVHQLMRSLRKGFRRTVNEV
jgi:hypothetical protein